MQEQDIVRYVREHFATQDPSVLTGTGPDDCAHLCIADDRTLCITTDTLVEGTHFLPTDPPQDVGHKAIAANLSDLAASGCKPRWGVVAAALQKGVDADWIRGLIDGMATCAQAFSFSLVGGDTTATSGPSMVTVTACGTPFGASALSRAGAIAGDALLVTGTLGGSLAGRHLRFTPRVREMEWLCEYTEIHASMDLSDGLALDLHRLLRESNAGAILDEEQIPISDAARERSQTSGDTPLHHALSDGEDFELLLSVSVDAWETLEPAWQAAFPALPLTRIGTVTQDKVYQLRTHDGILTPLAPKGYEHGFD